MTASVIRLTPMAELVRLREENAKLRAERDRLYGAARFAYSCHNCADCEPRLQDAMRGVVPGGG